MTCLGLAAERQLRQFVVELAPSSLNVDPARSPCGRQSQTGFRNRFASGSAISLVFAREPTCDLGA